MRTFIIASLSIALLFVVACTPSKQPTEQADTAPQTPPADASKDDLAFPKIEQKKWLLTEYGYQGRTYKPIEGHVPAIEVRGNRINGTTGCNRFNGEINLRKDGTMSVSDLGMTKKLCQGVMTQESRLRELLQNARSYSVNEMFLEINSELGQLSFRHPSE
ncbi:MAG: META domain-containing protein [Bacteroidetes bacterium]|jgi:heat shock protein HslJ|nr:META domain-containing protein [Bacteroidota bacterium]